MSGGQGGLDLLQPAFHRGRDVVAVLAHQHEAQAEHGFALAVGGDRAAADFVSRSPRRPRRRRGSGIPSLAVMTMPSIWSIVAVRPRPWTSTDLRAFA